MNAMHNLREKNSIHFEKQDILTPAFAQLLNRDGDAAQMSHSRLDTQQQTLTQKYNEHTTSIQKPRERSLGTLTHALFKLEAEKTHHNDTQQPLLSQGSRNDNSPQT